MQVDMEGKRADWEGVVLIPFLDEKRLLHACTLVKEGSLTADERRRNMLGDMLVFCVSPLSKELDYTTSTLPLHFPDVLHGQVRRCLVLGGQEAAYVKSSVILNFFARKKTCCSLNTQAKPSIAQSIATLLQLVRNRLHPPTAYAQTALYFSSSREK